jgi:hypothetical protein
MTRQGITNHNRPTLHAQFMRTCYVFKKKNKCNSSIKKMIGVRCHQQNLGYQMRQHMSQGFQGKAENIKQKKQQVTTSETAEVLHSISINKSQQI